MLTRILLIPVSLALGLPPLYGLTIACRTFQLLRHAGLYRGPINFVAVMPATHIGLTGKDVG